MCVQLQTIFFLNYKYITVNTRKLKVWFSMAFNIEENDGSFLLK